MPRFLFFLAWLELFWFLFLLSVDEDILRQFHLDLAANSAAYRTNLLALHFPPNDPIGSRRNWRPFWKLSINNRRTAIIFIRFLAYFPEANLSSTSLPSKFWKYSKTFSPAKLSQPQIISTRKYSKTFRPAATSKSNQQPQPAASTSSSNQQQQSTVATSSSNQQQQSTAAINSSNQQQQSTAATSSINEQQQPAAAINSSNQHQQSTAAISSKNQFSSYQQHLHNPRRLPLVSACPARCWYRISRPVAECIHRTAAYFCDFPFF